MPHELAFTRDLAYVFAAALVGGLIARALRQPAILGYVLMGILVGPFTPGPRLSELSILDRLAEVGVILLMYTVGVEFSIKELLKIKWVALVGAPIGIVVSILMSVGVGSMLGWSRAQGIAIGSAVCVASTMVLSRLLIEQKQLQSPHGRVMIGITLMEDLAVIIMTALIPAFAGSSDVRLGRITFELGKGLLLLIPVIFAAVRLVPPLMKRVGETKSAELYVLIVLALAFSTAALTEALGLSLALGSFLAGLTISETTMAREAIKRLEPLRDAFVALFFVTVGALIDPRVLVAQSPLLAAIVGLIVIGKLIVWSAVVALFRYPWRTALLVAVGLTQIGELSYLLARTARHAGMIGDGAYNAILAASLLSILANAALMRLAPEALRRIPA